MEIIASLILRPIILEIIALGIKFSESKAGWALITMISQLKTVMDQ